jgi:TetR/AcrR family transcriptional repressor of nem operon
VSRHFSSISPAAGRVVDVAEALLQHTGYNGFSYEDVARRVGIRKPSIHHHFPTKAELVTVVTQRYTHRFRERLLQIEGAHGPAPDRLAAYAALFEQAHAEDRRLCVCGMLGAEAEALPPDVLAEVRQFFAANLDWLTRIFAAGQAAGTLRATATAAAQAAAYLCALEGAMLVGRGAPASPGPAAVGAVLLASMRS